MSSYLVTVRPLEANTHERLYLLAGELTAADVERLTTELLHDPVAHTAHWQELNSSFADSAPAPCVEIAFRPGVTDNEAETILTGARHIGIKRLVQAKTIRRIRLPHQTNLADLQAYAYDELLNDLIETAYIASVPDDQGRRSFYQHLLEIPAPHTPSITRVPLRDASDAELERISREGILALTLPEMQAIREYFTIEQRDPTDGELETIAQTWSEHCRHKTFRARISYRQTSGEPPADRAFAALHPALAELEAADGAVIDGLLKHYLMRATEAVRNPALLSAFVDNAGIVAFDDDFEISFKVETHNHPSALEPFGGANTGVGGVVRDVLGVSAKPIAITDVLCFGPADLPEERLSPGVLHPRRIRAGVVAGVRDYGNKLGIPNINGAILYDEGYVANPLVFCGTVGIAPRGSHPRGVQPGDAIVVIGGRTGRDGIHGATFSSVELTHDTAETVGAAVQIGDPVTEKTVIDVLLQARELGLYSAITDCGAGGLSSAVGEMGEETGAQVELRDVPLKYAGLQPWEIWISEAQERMVVAVAPDNVQRLLELCAGEDVEATVIGVFTDDGYLNVRYAGQPLVDIAMEFLHSGGQRLELQATWTAQAPQTAEASARSDHGATLAALLAHPIIASKENVVRTYDHEVQGSTILKPLVGVGEDGPGDAGALQPRIDSLRGIVLGCGINPRYGKIDPYWMALAVVDEAMRNVVAAGGDPSQTWILDNFCWGDPKLPDRLAGLVRAAAGCHDAALAYKTPFISGKDSLNNEYRDAQGNRVAIPPTLLISAMALVPDVLKTISMDAKAAGNSLYLVGTTKAELGGALVAEVGGLDNGRVPQVDLAMAPRILTALHSAIAAGQVRACHDLSEGGLGVAAAEMAFAGELGMALDLRAVPAAEALDDATILWSESPTRFLVEVAPAHSGAFERSLAELPFARVGAITATPSLVVSGQSGVTIIEADVMDLKTAWQTYR
ncbi:MAG: phosphoribosylformylglycinamidine synthase subunit PurL [Herpetosiphonaceae bacterium]|nr:phosphoribosylformylglycinamidine synthase subunit PurL [Herpetosiphonaceae bacterium]